MISLKGVSGGNMSPNGLGLTGSRPPLGSWGTSSSTACAKDLWNSPLCDLNGFNPCAFARLGDWLPLDFDHSYMLVSMALSSSILEEIGEL
jgi:hypothetical protein